MVEVYGQIATVVVHTSTAKISTWAAKGWKVLNALWDWS